MIIGPTDYQYARLAAAVCEVAIEDYKDHLGHAQKAIERMNKACNQEWEMFSGYGDHPDPDKCEEAIEKILYYVNLISKATRDEQIRQHRVEDIRAQLKVVENSPDLQLEYSHALDSLDNARERKRDYTSKLINYLTGYLNAHYSKSEWECIITKFYVPALAYRRAKNKYVAACLDISRDEKYIHSDQWEIFCSVDPDMAIDTLRTKFNFEENYKWKLK